MNIGPLIIGDSAFPFKPWLLKPYTNAVLTEKQRYFNYRLSRARMVTEGAYGKLKGRWRVLLRKNESEPSQVKTTTLACMVLHNICIEKGDTICSKLDITSDPLTNAKRDSRTLRDVLEMTCCRKLPDSNSQATQIRSTLTDMFWREREGSELK